MGPDVRDDISGGARAGRPSPLIQHPLAVRAVQRERRHVDFKMLAAFADHLVAAGHEARGGLSRTPEVYSKRSPGASTGCLPITPSPRTTSLWPTASVMIQCRV